MKEKYFDLHRDKQDYLIVPEEKPTSLKTAKLKNKKIDFISKPHNKKILPKSVIRPFFRMFFAGAGVLMILLVLSGIGEALQLKNQTEELGYLAIASVQDAASNLQDKNFSLAINDFQEAEEAFKQAQDNIAVLTYKTKQEMELYDDLSAGDNFLKAGEKITKAAQIFLGISQKIDWQNQKNYLDLINSVESDVNLALSNLQEAQNYLDQASKGALADQLGDNLPQAQKMLAALITLTEKSTSSFSALKELLGDRYPHTVLVLLQNSREIRANGGFIGSLYFITFNNGEITKKEFRDVYDFDSYLAEQVDPPEPFSYLADNWGLRDANYYPNFPDSAQQIQWFLEHTRGDSVDTIVAIDEQVAERFLGLTGPLAMSNEEVNADNFAFILSFLVESKVFGKNSPKQVLADFLPQFEEKAKTISPILVLTTIEDLAREKHIMAYSFNDDVEAFFQNLGISGETDAKKTDDQVLISHTSFSANKSDGFVKESVQVESIINLQGEIYDTLKIKREHTWGKEQEDLFNKLYAKYGANSLVSRDGLEDIMGRGANRVWTRVYLPLGTELLSAKGVQKNDIKTFEENGFTVFSFYYPTLEAGKNEEVEIYYTLGRKLDFGDGFNAYSFCFDKSAGMREDDFKINFLLESGLKIAEATDEFPYSSVLKEDQCFRLFLIKQSYLNN